MTPHVVKNDEDAEAIKKTEAARMHWCLSDVIDIYGTEGGLRGRKDDWRDDETQMVYPDAQPGRSHAARGGQRCQEVRENPHAGQDAGPASGTAAAGRQPASGAAGSRPSQRPDGSAGRRAKPQWRSSRIGPDGVDATAVPARSCRRGTIPRRWPPSNSKPACRGPIGPARRPPGTIRDKSRLRTGRPQTRYEASRR